MAVIEYKSPDEKNAKGLYLALGCFACGILGIPAALILWVYIVVPTSGPGTEPSPWALVLLLVLAFGGTCALGNLAIRTGKSPGARGLVYAGIAAGIAWIGALIAMPIFFGGVKP